MDQARVVCEGALVASAPPKGEEPLCTVTIHGYAKHGPSAHWPSHGCVAVVSMLLSTKPCSVPDGNSKRCRCCQSSTCLFPERAAAERRADICVLRWQVVHASCH